MEAALMQSRFVDVQQSDGGHEHERVHRHTVITRKTIKYMSENRA